MNRVAILAVGVLLSACSADSPDLTPPTSASPVPAPAPPPGTFRLSGVLRDVGGGVVSSARVQLSGVPFRVQETASDDEGRYRFEGVSGVVEIRVFKPGYYIEVRRISVGDDRMFDVKMQRGRELTVGEVLRGIVGGEPCDPVGWDARAPCRIISFTAPTTGQLAIEITWTVGSDLDLLVGSLYFGGGSMPLHASFPVESGRGYELRLHSYYEQVEFEMRAKLLPPTPE